MNKIQGKPAAGFQSRSVWFHFAFAGLLSVVLALAGFAQSAAAPSFISGIVQDQSGAAIANAQVELSLGNLTQQTVMTDQGGNFRFNKIPPAKYQIRVTSEGFEPTMIEVTFGAPAAAPLRILLPIANVRTEVTVSADSGQITTEAADNKDSVALNEKALSNLPVFDQDYVGAMSRFLDPGSGGVSLVVNGMEVNNLGVSASAIKEIRINQNPYAAEFQRPGRGRIEVITKPGSTDYHGTFNFIFRDAHINARDPFAVVRPPEQRRIYEGYFSGPVQRHNKKTSFLFSINRNDEDLQAVVFARGPGGAINQNVATPVRNMLVAGQISHALSETNNFSIRYSYLSEKTNNQGVGGTNLPEAGLNIRNREQEITYSQEIVLSPKLVNNFRLLIGAERQSSLSLNKNPKIVVLDSFTGGSAQADQIRTEHHAQLIETLTYSTGRHIIKGGLNIPDFSRRGLDNNLNTAGTFYFSGLTDYLSQRPYSFVQQQGNGHNVFLQKQIGLFIQDDYHFRPNLTFSIGLRYDWENYYHDRNNLAPRFSFAYAPGSTQKTVIRGGGIFYDRGGPRIAQDVQLFNGSQLRLYVLPNPGFPDPLSGGAALAAQPVSQVRLAPGFKIPYTIQYSLGAERQLQKSTTVAVTYLGSRGIDLFRSRDINAPLPFNNFVRPDSSLGVVRQIEPAGRSASDALEMTFSGRLSRHFSGRAQYRLGFAHDNTSGTNYLPPNAYDLSGEWARADFDRRHRFELLGTINPEKLLSLGVSLSLYSGLPYTLTTGFDDFHTGVANARPAGVSRNSLQGPGYADLDLRWSHEFSLIKGRKKDGGLKGTLAVDAFNVLNRVNYASFVGNQRSPFFGQAVAAQPPRRLQFTFRLNF